MTDRVQEERRWRDMLECPYHHEAVEPRWDEEDGAVAWCPKCVKTIAAVNSRSQALADRDRYRKALYECAVLSGADVSDGAPGWPPVEEWAVQEVKQLRDDYDEALRDG